MAAPLPVLEGTKASIVEFLMSGGAGKYKFEPGGPARQEHIEDHMTQEGKGPLPMQAMEELYNDGIIDNPEGPPGRQGDEPIIKSKEWELTPYGERVAEKHAAGKKSKDAAKKDAKPKDTKPAGAKPKPQGTGARAAATK